MQRITHGIPALVEQSRPLGAVAADESITLSLVLPLRNEAALDALLESLYTPGDPAYGHYLTTQQFTAQFGPTQADYNAVVAWAKTQGLTVTQTYASRKIVRVAGPARVVERAFGVDLRRYQAPDGTVFRAPTSEARVPVAIATRLATVVGLDTSIRMHPHLLPQHLLPEPGNPLLQDAVPLGAGMGGQSNSGDGPGPLRPYGPPPLTGPSGGLGPFAIEAAYDLADLTTGNSLTGQTGAGQILGLVEFDGFVASNITAYETYFQFGPVPLQIVPVDNYNEGIQDQAGGAFEVTLDIDLMAGLAPGAQKILVYEAENNGSTELDVYQQIADDNLAKSISTSWGYPEQTGSSYTDFYNMWQGILKQMATQGQSIFAAAGDDGSWDGDGSQSSLHVDTPASLPYMVGVGGTYLNNNTSTGAYGSETVWNDGNGAGGGGISSLWTLPTWQQNIFDAGVTSNGSTTMRNVPDVSLNAGNYYAVYYSYYGGWTGAVGTSAAAPLWAGFTALVNQARVADNCPVLGFASPPIYYLATYNSPGNPPTGPNYTADFHDITVGNNNINGDPLHYPAVTGYDVATGWGSFVGANLLGDLTSIANTGTLNQLAGNSSFEQADANIAPWIATPNVVSSSPAEPAHSGLWMAWLCGYGTTHTDTLMQIVHIPALATAATLTFYLHIDTAETTTTAQNDTLQVQLRDTSGNVLITLGSYSNLNANVGYALQTFPLTPISQYAGQTVQIYLVGSENNSLQTSFVVDDFALTITE